MTGPRDAALIADAHNDLLCAVTARPPARWGAYFRERWLPQLRDGGVGLQVLPVFIDRIYRPEAALRQTLRMIEAANVLAAENAAEVALCADRVAIDAAIDGGRIALVLALEGTPGIGDDLELLATMHRLGVRMASLTHLGRSAFADGSAEDAAGSRLTAAGVRAIGELERLGMIVDISHLGAAGVEHVLDLATRPVIASHSSARALHDHHRNLTDAQLRGVAATGGVVCVNFYGAFLHATQRTPEVLAQHLEHVAEVAGIQHVGFGSDFLKEAFFDASPPGCERDTDPDPASSPYIPGLEGPAGMPLLVRTLRERGWTEPDIQLVQGANLHRLLTTELSTAELSGTD